MKTGAWLRGGRGKIAGMVAQKSSDGKGTILRELVTPSNPQSLAQMANRLAFGTVTQAAAFMLPIIGQTFRGQNGEKMNRRRFIALNVPLLQTNAISQSENGEIKAAFRGKSSNYLVPNAYRISEGSLVMDSLLIPFVNNAGSATPELAMESFTEVGLTPGATYKPAEILAQMFPCLAKQQITCCGIGTLNDTSTAYRYSGGADFVRASAFGAFRINFNQNAPSFEFTANTTEEQIKTYLTAGFDAEKTTAEFISGFISHLTLAANHVHCDVSMLDIMRESIFAGDYTLMAFGVILSELNSGIWEYSNSEMVIIPPTGVAAEDNNYWYGLTFNNALVDYMGSDAASKLFTRKGGLINKF